MGVRFDAREKCAWNAEVPKTSLYLVDSIVTIYLDIFQRIYYIGSMETNTHTVAWTDKDGHAYHVIGSWLACQALADALTLAMRGNGRKHQTLSSLRAAAPTVVTVSARR